MRGMKESSIVKKIKEVMLSIGATCHKMHGSVYMEAGTADLLGTLPGARAFYFEVKVPGKKPTPWQEKWLAEEAKRGALVGVVDSLESLYNLIHPYGISPDRKKDSSFAGRAR